MVHRSEWKIPGRRISLYPLICDDFLFFYPLNIHPFVRRYLWDDIVISPHQAREILLKNEQLFLKENLGLWKIFHKDLNIYIGYTGLWYFFDEDQPQLIYAMNPEHTGYGLATESTQLVIDYAFNRLNFNYIMAAMDDENQVSQKLTERLGMQRVDVKVVEGKNTVFYRLDKESV